MSDFPSADSPGVTRVSQRLAAGVLVELFMIDLTPLRVQTQFAFTTRAYRDTGPLVWRGITYVPLDVEASGFERSGRGTLPQPTIRISNVNRVMSSAAVIYDDLIGARLIRWRTYAQYLDNGDTPDPAECFAPDVYAIEQKVSHNKAQIEFKLAAAMDQEGRKLPGRVILRDLCLFRYRRWDAEANAFNYEHTVCPYAGNQSFNVDGDPVANPLDAPSRQLGSCCKPRFGKGPYPFGGFPGVQRIRA